MNPMFQSKIKTYERFEVLFTEKNITSVVFTKPDSTKDRVETFTYQPAKFSYDYHGYETVTSDGEPLLAARYTPDITGKYIFEVYSSEDCVYSGEFVAEQGDFANSYISQSKNDPRYFALDNGDCFFPIGLNMVRPDDFPAASGVEFGRTKGVDTFGIKQYEWWFKQLSENGGNFARLWLSTPYFNVETDDPSQFNYLQFSKLDALVKLAKKYSIRLKFTFDYFRVFTLEKTENMIFCKTLKYNDKICASGSEWINSELWTGFWFKKVDEYLKRYAGDPTVFAFELWNEMNCFDAPFEDVVNFTKKALQYLHKNAPKNMAVNSLGSFDSPTFTKCLDEFKMDEMSFQQLHRYIDQGAKTEIARFDPIPSIKDGLYHTRRPDKPVVLAETGAVNDCHSTYFRYYWFDHDGIIFTDVTYAPLFFESAASGQIWHWSHYVDSKNLWKYFAPLAKMVNNEQLDKQNLKSNDLTDDKAWITLLEGDSAIYGYVKSKEFTWYNVIRDMNPLNILDEFAVPLKFTGDLEVYNVWNDPNLEVEIKGDSLNISGLKKGFMFKIKK